MRFIQLYSGGNHNDANWDAHGDLDGQPQQARRTATDQPIAALIKDLKQHRHAGRHAHRLGRGVWPRQPTAEYAKGTGRDHNSYGFTMWLAGGGIKGGVSVGETDELGAAAVRDRFHVKHLHATILTLLGLDPNRLSFRFRGLDEKLVGVEGASPIREVLG